LDVSESKRVEESKADVEVVDAAVNYNEISIWQVVFGHRSGMFVELDLI